MVQIKDIYIPNAVCRPLTHNSFARGSNESPPGSPTTMQPVVFVHMYMAISPTGQPCLNAR